MKEQTSPHIIEILNSKTQTEKFKKDELMKYSDNASDFSEVSVILYAKIEEGEKIKESIGSNESSNLEEINLNLKASDIKGKDLDARLTELLTGGKFPENFLNSPKSEQKDWLRNKMKMELPDLPDNLINLLVGTAFDGDCGRTLEERPDWLDLEKFKRGQKFARRHAFGLSYAQLLSLFVLFSFEDGLKPLVITGKSSTPYTAFKRYLSTGIRLRNWYAEDPWTKDTAAYNDIKAVRKMHANVRRRLEKTKNEDIDAEAKIQNPYCPTRDTLLQDFKSACPAPAPGQCPYMAFQNTEVVPVRPKGLNQGEMVATQFGFLGLLVLYPKYFGVHNVTEKDLEDFCHTWRGLGYLLGIDDDLNLCRGSLSDIKQRCTDFLELWAKPNFRDFTPECEHMMRCVVDGLQYYWPGVTYEISILYLSEILNLHMPRLYSSLSYVDRIKHNIIKSFFCYTSRLPGMMTLMNKKLDAAFDKALNFNPEKHEELKKKSEESIQRRLLMDFSTYL
ncbi:uncharacterized protein LOC117173231 [Belonocnema kinseyi]|uniref:uncharacterized protein LOC117173231 n=1 Tax=Belonocnema kinseyi TaxID=2817044 RepID=UPI00143DEBC7|nr:uncharacterized protein LOC117173231 [Belonocnema kinseyi]